MIRGRDGKRAIKASVELGEGRDGDGNSVYLVVVVVVGM